MSKSGMERARLLLAEALEMDATEINSDTSIGAEERWDSLAHLRIIEAVEEAVGRPLEPESIVAISSLDDIAAILDRQNG